MRLLLLLPALLLATPALAQQGSETSRPAGWRIRYDRPNAVDSTLVFVDMAPGWHITTGPSALLWHPDSAARGDFRLESEIFLFPGDRAEGVGVVVGGQALDSASQRYTYFLVRKDGKFSVRRRDGAQASDLVPWTAHAAVTPQDKPDANARNVLAVDARGDSVAFLVNGQEVARLPRATVSPDGIVGLRVNHRLNVHVASLKVTRS